MRRAIKMIVSITMMSLFFSGVAFAKQDWINFQLTDLVSIEAVKIHQRVLEGIANGNDGNRAAGTKGYDQSLSYIGFNLWLAGLDVEYQTFEFPYFEELTDAEMAQTLPNQVVYPANDEEGFITMTYSGAGEVTALVQGVDLMIPADPTPNTSTSGCEADDFEGFLFGNIALLQRGACSFYDKAMNAQNAGAVAVIIFNEGQENRVSAFGGTLGQPDLTIPVVSANYNIGVELDGLEGAMVHIKTDTVSEFRQTQNIIAETPGGDEANTIILGAHLDSVTAGPGINDNGSGSAGILEAAMKIGWFNMDYTNKIKFAFWGAEELGLHGSEYFVANLTDEAYANIKCYLNFDMIASHNYVRFVFDGDGSDTDIAGPEGSDYLEDLFVDYFDSVGLESDPTEMDGRSDYAPFMYAGIPVGGLFTGAGGIKTEEQALIYGGDAGQPYDAYYHTADDTCANLNYEVEEQMLKAIAHSIDTLADIPFPEPEPSVRAKSAAFYSLDYHGPNLKQ